MMANVIEIDANNRIQASTTTDMNGNFTLAIKNPNNTLKVYFFGLISVSFIQFKIFPKKGFIYFILKPKYL